MAQPELVKYVWVTWDYGLGCRRPTVERYELVKKNPKGGVTVRLYGGTKVIVPSLGRKFFYTYDEMFAYYKRWLGSERDRAKDKLESINEDLAKEDLGLTIDARPSTRIRPPGGKLKTE